MQMIFIFIFSILVSNPCFAEVMLGAAVNQDLETQSQIWYTPQSATFFFKSSDWGFYLGYQSFQLVEKSTSLNTLRTSESYEAGVSYDVYNFEKVRPYLLLGAGQRNQTLKTQLLGVEQTFKSNPEYYLRPGVGVQLIFFERFSVAPQLSYQFFQTTSSPVISFAFIFGIIL